MDCLPAERDRNITMKTSAVSLLCKKENDLYYMTVVDSPGHLDFEAEVSNAVRLSDGCIVLVDAVEGVCCQTELVLRVAMREGLAAILVVNKIDRLFVERGMDPEMAELHLQQLLVDVNAATMLEDAPFEPALGNVVFASCSGRWGVTVTSLAEHWAPKLGLTLDKCCEIFWGQHYFDLATKKIVSKPPAPGALSFFAQAVLKPIYDAYQPKCNLDQLAKKLSVELAPRDTPLSLIARWRPLSGALIDTVLTFLKTPMEAQKDRIVNICPLLSDSRFESMKRAVECVDREGPVLGFAPKIVHGGLLRFPRGSGDKFVAYVRVYSGSIRIGDKLFVGHPKYKKACSITVESLYIFMGNELLSISRAPAGAVVGIGLKDPLFKQSTFAATEDMPLFESVTHNAQPIVKVGLEALDLNDQDDLVKGAELLAKIDPAVVVSNEANGQLILSAMGEVHLQFCIDELRNFLAKVEFSVSEPLVPCKETVIHESKHVKTGVGSTTMEASCFKLPDDVIAILERHAHSLIPEIREQLAPILGADAQDILDSQGCNLLFAGSQFSSMRNSIIAGFKLCVSGGPLCEEPIYGVGFRVDDVGVRKLTLTYLLQMDDEAAFTPCADMPLQFGETIGCTKEAFRNAFLAAQPRIMEPMYRCDVQSDFTVIGKTYEVLQQHRCRIQEEKQKENSNAAFISCFLPVMESFGFPNDLSSKTSGKAYPQLMFSHFELVTDDPFWKPQTEEELEFYSVDGKELRPNIAKKIIEYVRKRKGIWTENIEQKSDKRATLAKCK